MWHSKGEKQIPITSVLAVQWTPPAGPVNGLLHFAIAGSAPEPRGRDRTKDENTVMFRKSQTRSFEQFRDAIQSAIAARLQPHPPTSVPVVRGPSRFDQLKQLGELRDSGVLTPAEFEREKALLLGAPSSDTASVGTHGLSEDPTRQDDSPPPDSSETGSPVSCSLCEHSFATREKLNLHMKNFHPNATS